MVDHARERVATAADDLFDKYLLPKAALAVILTASLVGTGVSLSLSTGWVWGLGLVKWAYFVALGVLVGGLLWKHTFVRPGDVSGDAAAYTGRMFDRFDRITLAATIVLLLATAVVFPAYGDRLATGQTLVLATLAATGLFGVLAGWTAVRDQPAETAYRGPIGLVTLALGVTAVVGTAVLEVRLGGGGDPTAMAVRSLHLLAFSAWVGGAVWNIFAAVPSGQHQPTVAVIRAAGEQLERFRWVVRTVFPTILLTGFAQAYLEFGTALSPYTESIVGLAILAKLGFVALLFGIFLTCPMWRACSPIDGVCDLADLTQDSGVSEPSTTSGGGADD